MHALLVDHGFRHHRPTSTRTRREYYHLSSPAAAVLERVGNPALPVAVTVYEGHLERPVGTLARPESLRVLLERGVV